MKTLHKYISEKLVINKDLKNPFYDDYYKELTLTEAVDWIRDLNIKDLVCKDKHGYYIIVYHEFSFYICTSTSTNSKGETQNVLCFNKDRFGPDKFIKNEKIREMKDIYIPEKPLYCEGWRLCKYILNECIQTCIDESKY